MNHAIRLRSRDGICKAGRSPVWHLTHQSFTSPPKPALDQSSSGTLTHRRRHIAAIVLLCLLVVSCALFMEDLGAPNITMWDEVVHVNVIRNMAEHCCLPQLHKSDLGTNYRDWANNRIWLHKPLLPFYIAAAVYRLLGGSLWALRLPGAIFALLTAVVVYRIGQQFLNERIGLFGAAIFGLNPFTNSLVHGRTFSGFPDLAFALSMSVALYLILDWARSKSTATLRWFGLVVGIGYLCKGGLAFAPFVVLTEVALLTGPIKDLLPALQSVIVFGVIVLPGRLYWLAHYPVEFRYEQRQQLFHLFANIEGHGAPWHAYLTHTLPHMLVPPMIPFAYFSIGWFLARKGPGKNGLVLSLWILTYLVPLSLGVSKIDNFIFAVLPAIALLTPAAVDELMHGGWHRLVLGLCAMSWAAFLSWWILRVTHEKEGGHIWRQAYETQQNLAILIASAILTLAIGILFLTRGSKTLTTGALVVTSIALFSLYVGKDIYENRAEATEVNGGPSSLEQLRLRQAGLDLRALVDKNSLAIVSLGGPGPKYLYLTVLVWGGCSRCVQRNTPVRSFPATARHVFAHQRSAPGRTSRKAVARRFVSAQQCSPQRVGQRGCPGLSVQSAAHAVANRNSGAF